MKSKNIIRYIIVTALVLSVPLIAMQFSDEVQWNWFDFAVIGTLIISTGLIFEFITTKVNFKYRPVIAVVLLAAMLLIWAELAVGVFNSPIAGS